MEPLISVIIPIYNMEQYLARCLDSILANSYQNLEILCIDDGSTDRSLEILHDYERRDSRILVIAKENGGVSSARNAGLDRMTGEFVTFIDPDDLVHPQFFSMLRSAIEHSGAGYAICDYQPVEDQDFPLRFEQLSFRVEDLTPLKRPQVFMNHRLRSFIWGRLLSSKLVGKLRFREELSYSEDSVFFAEFAKHNASCDAVLVPHKLYDYYQREGSLVKLAKLPQREAVARFFVEKALASPENEEVYLDQAVKRCLSTWYLSAHILPDREIAKNCLQWLRPCMKQLRASSLYSTKQKVLYSVFGWFPQSYWLYRSITEPDMWAWEKVERRKRREAKKASGIQP